MSRAPLPFLALTALMFGSCGGTDTDLQLDSQAKRVILITCDTLRADRLGVYGFEGQTSPELDAFAEQCVIYEKAYAAASMTMPAFSSMLTGLLPDHTGVVNNHVLIPAAATTMAESLGAAGFETAAVVSNYVLRSRESGSERGMEQGFDYYDDTMNSVERVRQNVQERLAPDTTDAALAWLKGRSTDHFFLWVHYQDPHGPYTPPKKFVVNDEREGALRLPLGKKSNTQGNIPFYQVSRQNGNTDFYNNRYEAEIRFFDQELGRLLNALKAEALLNDALVIFTADHGESLGEHNWWFSHGQTLHNELVQVPLFVRYPQGMEGMASGRNSNLVGHVDLYATVLASVGLTPGVSHGESLLELVDGQPRLMCQSVWEPGKPKRWQAATDGRWRLIEHAGKEMLFDLDADPGELNDLLASEAKVADRLRAGYRVQLESLPALGERAALGAQSEEDLAEMRRLGYAGSDEDEDEPESERDGE
jgi:arylsulfatase A-like enzyme